MQPEGGSSGTPPQSGRGIPPRDNSLPVATVPPHNPIPGQVQEVPLEQLFNDARDEAKRRRVLSQLVQRMGSVPDISFKIWNSHWMIHLIIYEIRRIHPYIERQEEISEDYFDRAYSAITLLHPLAKDESIRYYFLKDVETVKHLLQSEIVMLCIRCMEVHSCESTIAVVVLFLEKIMKTDIGLAFICDDQELYLKIIHLLASMFNHPHITPSLRLLTRVVGCFYLFSCNPTHRKKYRYTGSFRFLFQCDKETVDRVLQVMLNSSFI